MTGPGSALPGYLRERMAEAGITSLRGLATRVGIAPETARRLLGGMATPDELTLRKLADGLPAPLPVLRRMAGVPSGERTPFVLPPEADQLDGRQRQVVLAMVHALLDASTRATGRDGRDAQQPVARLVGRPRDPGKPADESRPDSSE